MSLRHYGYNGINDKLRAARRRYLRATERVLNLHGWRTLNGRIEYVGKGPLARPRALVFCLNGDVAPITNDFAVMIGEARLG